VVALPYRLWFDIAVVFSGMQALKLSATCTIYDQKTKINKQTRQGEADF